MMGALDVYLLGAMLVAIFYVGVADTPAEWLAAIVLWPLLFVWLVWVGAKQIYVKLEE